MKYIDYADFKESVEFTDDFPNITIKLERNDSFSEFIKSKIETSSYLGVGYRSSFMNNNEIECLKIIGEISGNNLVEIRKICGGLGYRQLAGIKLKLLDLSEAVILKNEVYFNNTYSDTNYIVKDGVISQYMFLSCHLLEKVILPLNTVKIEAVNVFMNCDSIEVIYTPGNPTKFGLKNKPDTF